MDPAQGHPVAQSRGTSLEMAPSATDACGLPSSWLSRSENFTCCRAELPDQALPRSVGAAKMGLAVKADDMHSQIRGVSASGSASPSSAHL